MQVDCLLLLRLDKVYRCLARYSPRATTTNQMSWQGLAQNEHKTIGDEGITVDFSIFKVYTSN